MKSRDWKHTRGLCLMGYNCCIPLARAPVEDVAGMLAERAESWQRDVLGSEVIVQSNAVLVFRLEGQEWSIAVERDYTTRVPWGNKGYEWEKALSSRIRAPVICYGVSDTCGSIGYTFIEEGEVVEDFFAEDDDSRPAPAKSWFTSTRRQVRLADIHNVYDFVDRFFVEQDACDPGIIFDYFFDYKTPRIGESRRIVNGGFYDTEVVNGVSTTSHDVPEIERVDYLVLKSS